MITPSKATGRQVHIHFDDTEFACKHCGNVLVDPDLLRKLEALRQRIGRPISINSAYRCPVHNKAVGGEPDSVHMFGMASDITVAGLTVEQLAQHAEAVGFDGIGRYPKQNFVHVDVRGFKARWNG